MPTFHVEPQSDELLADIAKALLKARKVVVVTGAGISTNSGIPDFRSENGLYALVQAQFEAAARRGRPGEPTTSDSDGGGEEKSKPTKRRKVEGIAELQTTESNAYDCSDDEQRKKAHILRGIPVSGSGETSTANVATENTIEATKQPTLDAQKSTNSPTIAGAVVSSPLSSPPALDLSSPCAIASLARKRLAHYPPAYTSSPLSPPSSELCDLPRASSPTEEASKRQRSTSPSDAEDVLFSSNSLKSSQSSTSTRNSLSSMKGKDLFDASIWSDPLRTSVFYQFATSLRQKVKKAEPTSSHRFISNLRDRGKLVRCYTQNIDQIEEKVGLSTRLKDGPGHRTRFSRRSTSLRSHLARTATNESAATENSLGNPLDPDRLEQLADDNEPQLARPKPEPKEETMPTDAHEDADPDPQSNPPEASDTREAPSAGVECVFLHGSLELLRCFLCGKVCSWDDEEREGETLAGQQPECPHCVGATAAREEKGKRALGVGKLRPDIVLYGEEHPSSHLISPIVTHDLNLQPDVLLILGTSLRVHGLKVMVREFAKAVHDKRGKVVYVNFTKPPESSWGDVIDYWVEWDCDAWVSDLQKRVPRLWQNPLSPEPKRPRRVSGRTRRKAVKKEPRPPAANPVALRDTKVSGAYMTLKILRDLHRITGVEPPPPVSHPLPTKASNSKRQQRSQCKPKPRKKANAKPTTPDPSPVASSRRTEEQIKQEAIKRDAITSSTPTQREAEFCSILRSVKHNPRIRKRRMIYRQEVSLPSAGIRRGGGVGGGHIGGGGGQPSSRFPLAGLQLPPMQSSPMQPESTSPYGRPQPLEPMSSPDGPLSVLSPNLKSAATYSKIEASLAADYPADLTSYWASPWRRGIATPPALRVHEEDARAGAAEALLGMRTASAAGSLLASSPSSTWANLRDWDSSWGCYRR